MNKKAYYLGIVLIVCLLFSESIASFVVDDFITKGPWIDVKAYGAKGDGTIDDKTAIQNAINAIVNINTYSKSTIFFPPGQYCISGPLVFNYSRINLVGSGMHRTQIKASSFTGDQMLDFSGADDESTDQLYWTRISDLCIVGPGISSGTDGIKIGKMVGVDIRNVMVKNCNYGLYVGHTDYGSRLALQSVILTDSKHGASLKHLKGVNVNGLTIKPDDVSVDQFGLYLDGVKDSVFNNVWMELKSTTSNLGVSHGLYIIHSEENKKSERNTFINSVFTGTSYALVLQYDETYYPKDHIFINCNFSSKDIMNGSQSFSNKAPAYLIQCSGLSGSSQNIYGDFRISFDPAEVKAHTYTPSFDLKPIEARTYHTNKGAYGDVKLTLPDVTTTKGLKFTFAVLEEGKQLQVEPQTSDKIWGYNDGQYIYSSEKGASVTLVSDGGGDWIIVAKNKEWLGRS